MVRKKESLAKNALLNSIKQVCTIIFPLITFPYASRVLGAENYGKIGFSSSIVNYAILIAALGISNYAIREGAKRRNDNHLLNEFIREVFTINVISTVLAYFLLFISVLAVPKLKKYEALIAINSLVIAFNTIGRDWVNTIFEDYKYITIRYIISQSVAVILMFIFVHNRNDFYFYAFTSISGVLIANILNIIHLQSVHGINFSFSAVSSCIKHLRPILVMFGTAVAMQIYVNSDITIIGMFLGNADVGYYSAAVKVYTLVKSLINALLLVAVPRVSFELAQGEEELVTEQLSVLLNTLIIILLPAMVGIVFFSPSIIRLVAGVDFLPGSVSLSILGVALIFACLACFYIHVVMLPRNMENKILLISVVSASVNIVLNIILVPQFGIRAGAVTTAISELIMFGYGAYSTKHFCGFTCYKGVITGFFGIFTVIISYYIATRLINNWIIQLLFAIIISFIIYGPAVVIMNKSIVGVLVNSFKKKE